MGNPSKNIQNRKPLDISWKMFTVGFVLIVLVNYIFDEKFRPMRNVDLVEKIQWYLGFGAAYLLIPGLPILVIGLFPRLRLSSPKRTTLIVGSVVMVFSLLMTGLHLASE